MNTAIFMRSRTNLPETELTAPSPEAVAAAVPLGARLQVHEARLSELWQQRAENVAAAGALIAGREDDWRADAKTGRELNRLQDERLKIEREIVAVRQAAAPLREERAAKIATALGSIRREAAGQALAALAAIRSATDLLNQCRVAVERAGGGEGHRVILPDLGHVELLARRIAGAGK